MVSYFYHIKADKLICLPPVATFKVKLEGHSVCGSCAVLAEMVLTDIISTQRATYIYKLWGQSNPKILPNKDNVTKEKYVFKEILQLERLKNKRGFWVNQLSS